MTYFLEKYYDIGHDGKLHPLKYCSMFIRPCEWDYDKVRKFFDGKLHKDTVLEKRGQVAIYTEKGGGIDDTDFNAFSSAEEWLIWLNVNKGIFPDFEDVVIADGRTWDEYNAKTVDLRTNEVLIDKVDEIVKMINAQRKN